MKLAQTKIGGMVWHTMCRTMPVMCARIMYHHILGEWPNLKHPKSINEWINYLKFHGDRSQWAMLADKYAVRQYVADRGGAEILVKLYGKYDTAKALVADWAKFPDKFVIKSNNGCGTIKLVRDKSTVDLASLEVTMDEWLNETHVGLGSVEPHYLLIKPCLIVEDLLEDDSVKDFSCSLVDYKLWCFDGKPYAWFIAFDRHLGGGHNVIFDCYDLDWNQHSENMSDGKPRRKIPKPANYEDLLHWGAVLSKGLPQARVDFYSINGKVYFGEMTMTSQGGYMDYFTKDFLNELGSQVKSM